MIFTVQGRLLLLRLSAALVTSSLDLTAGIDAIVKCLFLAGACWQEHFLQIRLSSRSLPTAVGYFASGRHDARADT